MNDPCPSREQLTALLDDRLAEHEQLVLTAHLETCEACRTLFDDITAESRIWSEARVLATPSDHADTEAYVPRDARQADEEHAGALEMPGERPDHPSGLPFLEATEEPDRIGVFGQYEAIEIIGRGGFGIVLKAFDASLHRVVALKVLAPQLAAASAARRRFVREARAAASVAHEHVVTIHSVDEWNGWPYLVMQYVGGKSLQERIDKQGPLDVREILRIGMQTSAGLAAAHAQGLVHRDIKPANILLENGVERVKLTDFGLARAVDDPSLTQAGTVAGTPQYMSPEQAKGDPVDFRSDLFSLGCAMYAMATGQPPFRGSTTMSVLRKLCDEPPGSIRSSNSEIPLWLEQIIFKLLAKDPDRRFQTATELHELLADHLSRLQQGLPIVASEFDVDLDAEHAEVERSHVDAIASHFDVGPQKGTTRKRLKRWHIAAGLAALALLGVGVTDTLGVTQLADTIATVLRIKTAEGTLVVEIDDPEVQVSIDGGDVVVAGGGVKEIRLSAGSHQLQASRNGEVAPPEEVTVTRGGKKTWSARFEPSRAVVVAEKVDRGNMLDDLRARFEQCGQEQIAANAHIAELEVAYQGALRQAGPLAEILKKKEAQFKRAEARQKAGQITSAEVLKERAELRQAEAEAEIAHVQCQAMKRQIAAANANMRVIQQRQGLIARILRNPGERPLKNDDEVQVLARNARLVANEVRQAEKEAVDYERKIAETKVAWKQDAVSTNQALVEQARALRDIGRLTAQEVSDSEEQLEKARLELIQANTELEGAKARQEATSAHAGQVEQQIETDLRSLIAPRAHGVEGQSRVIIQETPASIDSYYRLLKGAEALKSTIEGRAKSIDSSSKAHDFDEIQRSVSGLTDDMKKLRFPFDSTQPPAAVPTPNATPTVPAVPSTPTTDPAAPVPPREAPPVPTVPRAENLPVEGDVAQDRQNWPSDRTWIETSDRGRWFLQSASAFEAARRETKPVLVWFLDDSKASDAAWARFDDENVRKLARDFVCARLYVDRIPIDPGSIRPDENARVVAENRSRAKELGVEEVPAFIAFHRNGRMLGRIDGKSTEFRAWLERCANESVDPKDTR